MLRPALIALFLTLCGVAHCDDPPVLSFGGGMLKTSRPKVALQVEYKGALGWSYLRPQVGVLTSEFNSFYAYAGLGVDLFLNKYIVFTPSFSPGIYLQGNGLDLGYPIEFRSSLELALRLPNKCRLGVMFFHLSNASLSSKNPGVNALMGFLAVPL